MKMTEALIAWEPGTDRVYVLPFPYEGPILDWRLSTTGACFGSFHKMNRHQQCAMLFINFHTILATGVPFEAAHRAFLKIDEYRQLISPDIKGADNSYAGPSPLGAPLE